MVREFLAYRLLEFNNYVFTVQNVVTVFFILLFTKVILYLIKKTLFKIEGLRNERFNDLYILNKVISYVVWVFSFIVILNSLGLKLTAILTGSAALLVGAGLGLQQTFNDFISGIILLFEGKTKVGDLLEIEGNLMTLTNIGLRTTVGVDRNGVSIIIPNSKIVTDKVINWSHQEKKEIRFNISVGVAYGTDVEKVIKILEDCAKKHPEVTSKDLIEARLVGFGDSSLNFDLLFFSKTIFRVEKIKSDIRKNINKQFMKNDISIPFPQMDIYLKPKRQEGNHG